MPGFERRNHDFAEPIQSSFDRQQVMALPGAKLARPAPGEFEIQLPFKTELTRQHGYFHGGIIGTIANSTGDYAGFTLIPEDASVLTVEFKMNLLAHGDGDLLVARETLCATLLQTLMTMHGRPDL